MPFVLGAMLSDVGRIRRNNEDQVLFSLPPPDVISARRVPFALVADGMGGHNAGEVASALAVEIIRQILEAGEQDLALAMQVAFMAANRAIHGYARDNPDLAGMGTTCTLLMFAPEGAMIGHVGDSRAYRLRQGQLAQLTQDQTLTAALLRNGGMTPQEASQSELGNVLTQAVGTHDDIAPQIWIDDEELRAGDVYLLCSDGLSGPVSDPEIIGCLLGALPAEACRRLIDAANAAGGGDNVSVGVFHIQAT